MNDAKTNGPKQLRSIERGKGGHWVGDGFPVRTLFAYPDLGPHITPFLMLDYGGPVDFPPTKEKLGVGSHPHRGFETVTIVYDGEVEHRDSAGGGGMIGPGDIQWMTAASGLVHEEFHGRGFAARGGRFEMVQLWVNLPARHKLAAPGYQAILDRQVPAVAVDNGTVRVIAGGFRDQRGPARTFTPMNVWDLKLDGGGRTELPLPDGWPAVLVLLHGSLRVNGRNTLGPAEAALFERSGSSLVLDEARGARALLLSGEPIDEPIAGMGPFVMNTQQEIRQAVADFQNGRMGRMAGA